MPKIEWDLVSATLHNQRRDHDLSENVPIWERVLRVMIGVLFIGVTIAGETVWGGQSVIVTGVLLFSALFVVVTGFVGWCPACALGTLRTVSAFTAWVFRVVRHECYRLFRQTKRETTIDKIAETCYAEDPIHHHTLRQDVVVALKQLPFVYRQVVAMRDIEEMTAPEVAATLGLTVEAVKSRLHRGRKMIRLTLQHWTE